MKIDVVTMARIYERSNLAVEDIDWHGINYFEKDDHGLWWAVDFLGKRLPYPKMIVVVTAVTDPRVPSRSSPLSEAPSRSPKPSEDGPDS